MINLRICAGTLGECLKGKPKFLTSSRRNKNESDAVKSAPNHSGTKPLDTIQMAIAHPSTSCTALPMMATSINIQSVMRRWRGIQSWHASAKLLPVTTPMRIDSSWNTRPSTVDQASTLSVKQRHTDNLDML